MLIDAMKKLFLKNFFK